MPGPDGDRVQPDWDAVIEALTAPRKRRRARLTRRQLWIEYRDEALALLGKAYAVSKLACAPLRTAWPGWPCEFARPHVDFLAGPAGSPIESRVERGLASDVSTVYACQMFPAVATFHVGMDVGMDHVRTGFITPRQLVTL